MAYPGILEIALLRPIETKNWAENDLLNLPDTVRGMIAEELAMENEKWKTEN